MTDSTVLICPTCGQKNRFRADAAGVPHCGKCGQPLPWLVEAGGKNFEAAVEKAPIPVLIDFWAPWCGPCRIVAPAVERLSEELAGRLKVAKLNTDDEPALGDRFRVRAIPTLVLMQDGRERDRVTGALNVNALRDWVEKRLAGLATG
jgi:thioredoxin 2